MKTSRSPHDQSQLSNPARDDDGAGPTTMMAGMADLRGARIAGRAEARGAILAAAAAILTLEGPAALTVRRVAKAINASTKVIYTGFGGKEGLLDALYVHSFSGLRDLLLATQEIEPAGARILAMCAAYRSYAVANPALYHALYGEFGDDFVVPLASRRYARSTFDLVRGAVAAALPPDRIAEAELATRQIWAAMHGVVSLEVRQLLGEASECEQLLWRAVKSAAAIYDIELDGPPSTLSHA